MHLSLPTILLLPALALSAVNGPCAANRQPGVCVTTSTCSSSGGTSVSGFCPNDPSDVRCCVKSQCSSSSSTSQCRWTNPNSCSGNTASGLCPGPSDFRCCLNPGTWSRQSVPTNRCQSHVISAGNSVAQRFSGNINTMYCYGERSGASDHPSGLAIDFMVGSYNPAGFEIAEYVMNNCASLRCTYVIWGAKIWNRSRDPVARWESWRELADRGSITANHWDHPHVSFQA